MSVETGCIEKEEGIIELSQKLKAEAEGLLFDMKKFLCNPPETGKDQKECRGIMSSPFDEIRVNLRETLSYLNKIQELFNTEVFNKLK